MFLPPPEMESYAFLRRLYLDKSFQGSLMWLIGDQKFHLAKFDLARVRQEEVVWVGKMRGLHG